MGRQPFQDEGGVNQLVICSETSSSTRARTSGNDNALRRFNFLPSRAICIKPEIRDLPSSTEGAIKVDEICRYLGVAVGKIIFALQQLGLCRDDIQEIDRTFRVTLSGGLQRGLIFGD